MTLLIDGIKLSSLILDEIKFEYENFKKKIPLGLATILVGEDKPSQIYVNKKQAAALDLGFLNFHYKLNQNTSQDELIDLILKLNNDKKIHAILLQLPLPIHINTEKVIEFINPKKDVDGIHSYNIGKLFSGKPNIIPCTPLGCLYMIKSTGVKIEGKHAVVVGRSNIVGKPMAELLLNEEATVTVCHQKTKNLSFYTKEADILVVATGNPHLINNTHIKKGSIIIDVGINRISANKIVGDVDTKSCMGIASYITKVPGGVGPMTIAMLMKNALVCFKE